MRLATLSTPAGTTAARLGSDGPVGLGAPDVGALLTDPAWRDRAAAGGPLLPADARPVPVVPRPGKIVCVGLNYRAHLLEMGRELPAHPTLFAKFPEALLGPCDPLVLDGASAAVDWEAELAVVVGSRLRHASAADAEAAIAGFSLINDVTMRDWQYRTSQWLQGKTFEASAPFGPCLVTPDELPGGCRPSLTLRCAVNDRVVQEADTADLLFGPVDLLVYLSGVLTLNPGDVVCTGTPDGVGHARRPPEHLRPGDVLVTESPELGRLVTPVVRAAAAGPRTAPHIESDRGEHTWQSTTSRS
ncbi:fumarylacetoacetate hydrolase family protein [Pseudonocardia halophobica]|uniref:fumarylacetoacetate hydrolase family protein n=1 Tax=Pseudonocardia halophobica TaxID=29401 RepID=UPI003D8E0634